ncbi:hypothetical protein D9757_008612 [Collybiopsis confluens]|uniref:Protein kinase domain-containing protein n=1 Tax=Collybiopsis confluens TaxID=2823264 RepID=A0A8H5HNE6_9AGAR|nr:hypothetical protein D9757_008612 [Collybiopsis confluens]
MQNRDLRMWFACRGVIFVTEAVDVFTNPDPLVRFFASIAFSSRTPLGWDPTIEVTGSPSPPRQYEITVNGRKFTTVKNLADYSADSLVSRATRVWLVKDEEGQKFVLKDVWMDTDRLPEHEIRDNLLEDVLKKRGPNDHRKLSNHMLTPRVFERMKINDMDDTTPRMMNEQTPATSSIFKLTITTPTPDSSRSSHPSETSSQGNRSGTSKGTAVQIQTKGSPTLTLRSKYHYRIVFEEHGTDLYSEMSLHNVFKTLSDLVDALEIIHRSGWVHRDISCGNVYCLHDPVNRPRGIVGDFEYAKRCDDQVEHEKRTGTSEFMAYEAASQRYRYLDRHARLTSGLGLSGQAKFAHNPLHDLESLWWILLYIILHKDDSATPAQNPQNRNLHVIALFQSDPRSLVRGDFIADSWKLTSDDTGVARSFEPALKVAQGLSDTLLIAYTEAEAGYTVIDREKCMVHHKFHSLLNDEKTLEAIKDIKLVPVVEDSAVPNSSEKRKQPPCDEINVPQKRGRTSSE